MYNSSLLSTIDYTCPSYLFFLKGDEKICGQNVKRHKIHVCVLHSLPKMQHIFLDYPQPRQSYFRI